jgi:glycosyltransferase involved in cell wall biosynthesis
VAPLPLDPSPEVSVVVLCYRAEDEAGRVVEPIRAELEALDVPHELILVANYWRDAGDRTPEAVRALARGRESVRTVAHPKQGGMGWDMRSGLQLARGEYLVVIDGDGQVPPHFAVEAYKFLKETAADVVKGRRHSRDDGSIRSLTSVTYNSAFRVLFGSRGLWDINGRPKALTRAAYERLNLGTDDWFTDAELVLKARRLGLRVVEMPVYFLANPVRASFVGPGTVFEFVRNMLAWRFGRHPAMPVREDETAVSSGAPVRVP